MLTVTNISPEGLLPPIRATVTGALTLTAGGVAPVTEVTVPVRFAFEGQAELTAPLLYFHVKLNSSAWPELLLNPVLTPIPFAGPSESIAGGLIITVVPPSQGLVNPAGQVPGAVSVNVA